ncbi:MAG: phage portal protein [Alphaproteobacteria bacterium]|nr:phage portal protein [Alphaproteobacteria bacterium]MAS46447.1 phage portal protein [Alphaproteobacteria bacterium]MAX94542.1 phage portal protein [Alphaproteobacteria bacterium]MBN54494.1 phage portal protein [Alphaproteobacteria bacterium]OUT41957.1 MAG: phage portal protein [Micavibrio sp. TMED2]|tara:strand:- start:13898 stop:15511 length:1614 start_codon:yes stop_codon:yes gene_type:complete
MKKVTSKPGFSMTTLDKMLLPVAPGLVAKRVENRFRVMAATGGTLSPEAKRVHRKRRGNKASANESLLTDISDARALSLEHVTTGALPKSIITTHVGHTVGGGLRLDAQPDGESLQLDPATEAQMSKQMEMLWRIWCKSADFNRQWSFNALQQIIFAAMLVSGDCLVVAVDDGDNLQRTTFTTRLQVIEAQRVSNPDRRPDDALIAGGVERDEFGRIVAYHVCSGYPEGYGRTQTKGLTWRRIPAFADDGSRYVYHVMDPLLARAGQNRGVPLLAPVISQLKQLSDMTEAELTASVLAACLAVFKKTLDGDGGLPTDAAGDRQDGDGFQVTDVDFGPGMVFSDMQAGEEIGSIAVNRPNTAFAQFWDAIVAEIAAGTDLSKEVLTRHFQSSYSASRGALGEVWRLFIRRREFYSEFCQWAYELMLQEAQDRDLMTLSGFDQVPMMREAWCQAKWVGPPMPQMDEQKAVSAATKRIEAGLSTRKDETAKLTGGDFNANHRQLSREQEMRDEAGLVGAPAIDPNAAQDDAIRPNQVDAE